MKRDFDMLVERANELPEATRAKYSKPSVYLGVVGRFPRAMLAISQVSKYGADKHRKGNMSDMGFLNVPDAEFVYLEAEMRHAAKEAIEGPINEEDGGLLHKAQKAWNALADLEVYLREHPVSTVEKVGK